jgi:hypothetical protein
MTNNKKFIVYVDILGFDNLPKQIMKIHRIPSSHARKNFSEKVEEILQANAIYSRFHKTSADGYMLLFDDICPVIKYIYDLNKTIKSEYNSISLEICVNCGDIDLDEYWLTDAAVDAHKICGKYRENYKSENRESLKSTFILFTTDVFNDFNSFVLNKNISLDTTPKKIFLDEFEVFYIDMASLIANIRDWRQFDELKKEVRSVSYPTVEKELISVYDPAHLGDTVKNTIATSNKIDLFLYTAETFAITYREELLRHSGVECRILTRNPYCETQKKEEALDCIYLWSQIAEKNEKCKINMRLYNSEPLLRAIIFNGVEGFLGMYRYDPKQRFQFIGVESNKLIYVRKDNDFGTFFLDLYQSRFDFAWQNAKAIQIPLEDSP